MRRWLSSARCREADIRGAEAALTQAGRSTCTSRGQRRAPAGIGHCPETDPSEDLPHSSQMSRLNYRNRKIRLTSSTWFAVDVFAYSAFAWLLAVSCEMPREVAASMTPCRSMIAWATRNSDGVNR